MRASRLSEWAALCGSLVTTPALADGIETAEEEHVQGTGSVSLAYQSIEVNEFDTSEADVNIGEVLTHSLYLEFSYAPTERWLLTAGIPFIKKKYNGPGRHDPLNLDPPRPEVPFVDDGRYHDEWQDFVLGASYLWINDPVIVEPFAYLIIPSHDYPHFAQAAVGQNVWKAEFGIDFTKYMLFSDWFYRGGISYTIVEDTLDVNVNHFRLRAEAGYFLTPDWSASAFVLGKFGNGKDATEFAPAVRRDEDWYQHDRTTRHSYANIGASTEWYINDGYTLTVSALTSFWGKSVHMVNLAWTIGLTRYF